MPWPAALALTIATAFGPFLGLAPRRCCRSPEAAAEG